MSATEALRMARDNGVHLGVAGTDLILDAEREPAPQVLEAIRRHKAGIIALLRLSAGDWVAEEWRVFFDERAAIAEFDGNQPRINAEAVAFECCVVEWLNRHPDLSDPGCCTWCGQSDQIGSVIVPFGIENQKHTWLHHECWPEWSQARRAAAEQALAAIGIHQQP